MIAASLQAITLQEQIATMLAQFQADGSDWRSSAEDQPREDPAHDVVRGRVSATDLP